MPPTHAVNSSPANTDATKPVDAKSRQDGKYSNRQSAQTSRWLMTLCMFVAYVAVYSERSHLGVTLVSMLNSTFVVHHQHRHRPHHQQLNLTRRRADCKAFPRRDNDTGEFGWDSHEQGIVLAAFYYGYVVTQLIGGCVPPCRAFSGRCLLLCGSLMSCAVNLATPIVTTFGNVGVFIATRVVDGIGQGIVYASSNVVLSHWSSPDGSSSLNAVIYSGAQLGTVVSLALSAVICHLLCWQVVFYAVGGMAAASWLLTLCLMRERPVNHLPIDAVDDVETEADSRQLDKKLDSVKVPWNDILRSGPVLSLVLCHFASNAVYHTLLSCLPLYFHFVLRFKIIINGLLCCLAFCTMWVVMVLGGLVAERLRTTRTLSTTNVRKLFCAAGFLLPAACLIGAAFVKCDAVLSACLLVVSASLLGLSMSCWAVNHLDLAPPFAGQLMSFSNVVATVPGALAPSIVGLFTFEYPASIDSWRNVFFTLAGVLVVATVVFWIAGSGQRQWWAIYVEMPGSVTGAAAASEAAAAAPVTDAPSPAAAAAASDADNAPSDDRGNADEQRRLANADRTELDAARDTFASFWNQRQRQQQHPLQEQESYI